MRIEASGEVVGLSSATWHIVYTNPRSEERAVRGLTRRGIKSWQATFRAKVYLRRRVLGPKGRIVQKVPVVLKRALFPRYLFIELTNRHSFEQVREVDGIADFIRLRSDGSPAIVSLKQIEDLQVSIDMGGFDVSDEEPALFKAGTDVMIATGSYAGFPAKVARTVPLDGPADRTVQILARLFGYDVPLTMPLDRIRLKA